MNQKKNTKEKFILGSFLDINQFEDQEDEHKLIHATNQYKDKKKSKSQTKGLLGILNSPTHDLEFTSKTFYKFLVFRHVLLYLTVITYIFSLIQYFGLNYTEDANSLVLKFLMYTNLGVKSLSVFIFILSREYYDEYYYCSRYRNKNIVIYKKYHQRLFFYIKIVLLFVHPFYFLRRQKFGFDEFYFYQGIYYPFQRNINDYLFIIQFTISFLFIFVICLELTRFFNYRTYRMCNFFGVTNDYFYVLKSIIFHYGVYFIALLVLIGIFFFSGLIIVAERGFYLYKLNQEYIDEIDEQLIENSKQLSGYFNAFWNMLITMTTIGYGDLFVKTQLARFIVFFCALYGLIIFPLLVVTITNMFKLSYEENASLNIMKLKYSKREMKKPAINFIIAFLKYIREKQSQEKSRNFNYKKLQELKDKMIVRSVNFKKAYRAYYNILGNDQNNHILRQTLILNKKFNTISKKLFPLVLDFQRNQNESFKVNSLHEFKDISPKNDIKDDKNNDVRYMSMFKQFKSLLKKINNVNKNQ